MVQDNTEPGNTPDATPPTTPSQYRMHWYKFYFRDFRDKTRDLTLLEKGIYRELLDHFYANMGEPLPGTADRVFRMIGAINDEEQDAVVRVIAKYWRPVDGGFVNDRALSVIRESRKRAATNKENRSRGTVRPSNGSTNGRTNGQTKVAQEFRVQNSEVQNSHSQNRAAREYDEKVGSLDMVTLKLVAEQVGMSPAGARYALKKQGIVLKYEPRTNAVGHVKHRTPVITIDEAQAFMAARELSKRGRTIDQNY